MLQLRLRHDMSIKNDSTLEYQLQHGIPAKSIVTNMVFEKM